MLREFLIKKGLSNREAEVAELVSQGLPNKEVAAKLFVTEKTVKFHLTNIYKKMNVKSRAQLIVWCLPAMNFINEEARKAPDRNPYAGDIQGIANHQGVNSIPNTIPAGNTTVSGVTGETYQPASTPTSDFLPHRVTNNDIKSGNNSGSDMGSGSF